MGKFCPTHPGFLTLNLKTILTLNSVMKLVQPWKKTRVLLPPPVTNSRNFPTETTSEKFNTDAKFANELNELMDRHAGSVSSENLSQWMYLRVSAANVRRQMKRHVALNINLPDQK